MAVLRLAAVRSPGSGNRRTRSVRSSTRTIAFRPPSVTHAARSGPTITPCGARAGAERHAPAAPGPRVEPAQLARRLGREPHRPVVRRRHVMRPRAFEDRVLAQLHGWRARTAGEPRPRVRLDRGDDLELALTRRPARPPRPPPRRGPRRWRRRSRRSGTRAPCCSRAAGCVGEQSAQAVRLAFAVGRAREGAGRHQDVDERCAAEGQARGLPGPAIRAGEHLTDRDVEPPERAADRPCLAPPFRAQVALPRAVAQVACLVRHREVGRGVAEQQGRSHLDAAGPPAGRARRRSASEPRAGARGEVRRRRRRAHSHPPPRPRRARRARAATGCAPDAG